MGSEWRLAARRTGTWRSLCKDAGSPRPKAKRKQLSQSHSETLEHTILDLHSRRGHGRGSLRGQKGHKFKGKGPGPGKGISPLLVLPRAQKREAGSGYTDSTATLMRALWKFFPVQFYPPPFPVNQMQTPGANTSSNLKKSFKLPEALALPSCDMLPPSGLVQNPLLEGPQIVLSKAKRRPTSRASAVETAVEGHLQHRLGEALRTVLHMHPMSKPDALLDPTPPRHLLLGQLHVFPPREEALLVVRTTLRTVGVSAVCETVALQEAVKP